MNGCVFVLFCCHSTALTHRSKSPGLNWARPSIIGQFSSQLGCVSCNRWQESRRFWSTWSPSLLKAKSPWSPGWASYQSKFVQMFGLLLFGHFTAASPPPLCPSGTMQPLWAQSASSLLLWQPVWWTRQDVKPCCIRQACWCFCPLWLWPWSPTPHLAQLQTQLWTTAPTPS